MAIHPMERAREVVGLFREFSASAPEELCCLLTLRLAPFAPFLPKEVHGKPIVGIAVCHSGSLEDGACAVVVNVAASWEDPTRTNEQIAWARGCWSNMQQFSTGGVNVNFLTGEEGGERVRAAYGSGNYKRLVELKNKYDPQNMFRLNQNIPSSV